jgi:hypothetical protein
MSPVRSASYLIFEQNGVHELARITLDRSSAPQHREHLVAGDPDLAAEAPGGDVVAMASDESRPPSRNVTTHLSCRTLGG